MKKIILAAALFGTQLHATTVDVAVEVNGEVAAQEITLAPTEESTEFVMQTPGYEIDGVIKRVPYEGGEVVTSMTIVNTESDTVVASPVVIASQEGETDAIVELQSTTEDKEQSVIVAVSVHNEAN